MTRGKEGTHSGRASERPGGRRLRRAAAAAVAVLAAALLASGGDAPSQAAPPPERPNFVVLVLDDLNMRMSSQPSPLRGDPHPRGLRCSTPFSTTPLSCPRRSALFTLV